MKITRIRLKDFRAFKGEYDIDLNKGRNLLLYGENGSGKSSLFQALNLFFAPATPFLSNRNLFVTTDDGYVKLEIQDGTNPSQIYEWEQTTHPSTEPVIAEASKTKGFLDYRALLETHFVHRHVDSVNVFELLLNALLPNTRNPITNIAFKDEWESIQQLVRKRPSSKRNEQLRSLLKDFNDGLINVLNSLTTQANTILALFDQELSIKLTLPGRGVSVKPRGKTFENEVVQLTVTYYGQPLVDHHHFLNEARLSAIAISIYLAALLLNPPSQLRMLFLDDLLIGLDTCNRLPVLDVLAQFFSDWQIILATFDRVWFEMAWQRVKGAKTWERAELHCARTNEGEVPVYQGNTEYLVVASQHLVSNDLKAAAIYIRSAYELALKGFCDKFGLSVRYHDNPKDQKSEEFWHVVKAQKRKDGTPILPPALVTDIELYRSSVLNKLSHTAPVNLIRKEVEEAFNTVGKMRDELGRITRADLA